MIGTVLGRRSAVWIRKPAAFKFASSHRMVSIDFNEEKGYSVITKMGERMSLNPSREIELKALLSSIINMAKFRFAVRNAGFIKSHAEERQYSTEKC